MALHTNTSHADAGVLQLFHQPQHALAFFRFIQVKVVVIELYRRVGFLCQPKSGEDIVITKDLPPFAVTQATVFIQRFIDHVPAFDLAAITPNDGLNMPGQPLC